MRNLFQLILVSLVFCMAAEAQLPTQSEPTWTSLQPEGEIFSVELPSTISTDRSQDKSLSKFWTSINGDYFMIFSEKLEKLQDVRIALEYIRSHQKQGEKESIGLVHAERYDFEDEDSFYHTAISFTFKQ